MVTHLQLFCLPAFVTCLLPSTFWEKRLATLITFFGKETITRRTYFLPILIGNEIILALLTFTGCSCFYSFLLFVTRRTYFLPILIGDEDLLTTLTYLLFKSSYFHFIPKMVCIPSFQMFTCCLQIRQQVNLIPNVRSSDESRRIVSSYLL